MKPKHPLWIAIAAGLFSFLLIVGYLQLRVARLDNLEEPIAVVIISKDLPEGFLIDESILATRKIPRRFVQPQAFLHTTEAVGQISKVALSKGEQLLKNKVRPLSAESGLAVRMPGGYRALSLEIDDVSGVGGLIRPNNFVDLVATFELADFSEQTKVKTKLLVERALVLAVGQDLGEVALNLSTKSEKKSHPFLQENFAPKLQKTVTLSLTPEQILKVEFAKQGGKISLALRGQWDTENSPIQSVGALDVIGFEGNIQGRKFREYRGK